MKHHRLIAILAFGLLLALVPAQVSLAHRPYFEQKDISYREPWKIDAPTISTAIYATLESTDDVDYFTFYAEADQLILLSLTIPQIEGQDLFAPAMALLGPGLPESTLPERVERPDGTGVYLLPPLTGPAETFFEPFSRTSYWERQEEYVIAPVEGAYVAAVWHPQGEIGRYVFVIGDEERPGGDLTFPLKMGDYWTPVGTPPSPTSTVRIILWAGAGLGLLSVLAVFWVRIRKKRVPQQA
jgi:hypothetical protein